jgi:hypothetical protein
MVIFSSKGSSFFFLATLISFLYDCRKDNQKKWETPHSRPTICQKDSEISAKGHIFALNRKILRK